MILVTSVIILSFSILIGLGIILSENVIAVSGSVKSASSKTIKIDFNSKIRTLPLELIGIFGQPYLSQIPDKNFEESYKKLKEAGIYMVDIQIITDEKDPKIPYFTDFSADAEREKNYDFTSIDKRVKVAVNNGLKIQLSVDDINKAPSDYDKYGKIVEHLMKHLTEGWADGFKLTSSDIRLVIYANEPDLVITTPQGEKVQAFWQGTSDEFNKSYVTFAKAVKSVNKDLPVGGPAYAFAVSEANNAIGDNLNDYVTTFLDYVKKNGAPLDYFSWHHYGFNPGEFSKTMKVIKTGIAKYSTLSPLYGTPKIASDEWDMAMGIGGRGPQLKGLTNTWGAAARLSNLIAMTRNGLSASTLASGFEANIIKSNGSSTPSFYMFKGLSRLEEANILLSSSEGDGKGFDTMSVKSEDGKKVVIFVSNFNANKYEEKVGLKKSASVSYRTSYDISLTNLPWSGKKVSYSRYVIDDSNNLKLSESATLKGGKKMNISEKIAMPQIQVIVLSVK